MTKGYIYQNIERLETIANKYFKRFIKENGYNIKTNFDETIIADEARRTDKETNYYVQFSNFYGYTEIAEIENYILITTMIFDREEEEAKEQRKKTRKEKKKTDDNEITVTIENKKLYETIKLLSSEFYNEK